MRLTKSLANLYSKLPQSDHRQIGLRQKLFFFDELSQGSCFFQPRGAHIYNKLIAYLRQEYKRHHYHEVITPNIYNCDIWKTSGHWDHYESNMIKFKLSERDFSLKPMNCPGHCLMYKHQNSIRGVADLPVRWADFGVLHRNELSGSLTGLTRGRKFQQDDAHIFCTPDQVSAEVEGCLMFAKQVYENFGFTFDVKLSLRPRSYLGSPEIWDKAEESLRKALGEAGLSFEEEQFEGAFYGPKIDLAVKDCLDREHQCATIQLDFQLPERFELQYRESDGVLRRPVIIHRAILGSIERFMAMVAENSLGRWPFWLSPLQAQVVPVHTNFNPYAKTVCDRLRQLGYWVDCDLDDQTTLNAKVRDALMIPYNLILVVGQNEANTDSVTVRIEEDGRHGSDANYKCSDSQPMAEVSGEKLKRRRVRNMNIPMARFVDYLSEFERSQVDRADLELLDKFYSDNCR